MWQQESLEVRTGGRGVTELTGRVQQMVRESGVKVGLCHLFIHHTSASLMLCENADPTVLRDMEAFMGRMVPDGDPLFHHTMEGPDDMPAHVRSVLTQSGLTLPISDGVCRLGTWQGIYLWEHRHRAHRRTVTLTIHGEL